MVSPMARIRTIKPEFFTDSKVLCLTPLARLFYVSLWCEADKQGRLKWDPQTLKYRYLPADKARVEELGKELLDAGLIRLYEAGGQILADIPGFVKHQVINNREVESSLPPYSDDACVTRESGDRDAAHGKEGRKGREGKEGTTPVAPKGGEYPKDFRDLVEAYPKRQGTNPLPRAWKAYNAAIDRGAAQEQLLEAARAYGKTDVAGTKFCQQLATWLNGDEWRQTATVTPIAEHFDPESAQLTARCLSFAKSGFWNRDQWGPEPGSPGCRVPANIIAATNADGMTPPSNMQRAG